MSAMEHLFMQIFERRDWIACQLRQQGESFAQSVASNLLAAGGVLPPWLWTAAAGYECLGARGHPELYKEKITSGMLYSFLHSIIPNGDSFSDKPFQKNDNLPQTRSTATCVETPFYMSNYRGHKENEDVVMDSFEKVQSFSVLQSKIQGNHGKQRSLSKQRSRVEYTGRITRSRSASMKTYHVKLSSDIKKLSEFPVEFDENVNLKHDKSLDDKETQFSLSIRGGPVSSGTIDYEATPNNSVVCSRQHIINSLKNQSWPRKDKVMCQFRGPNSSCCSKGSMDDVHDASGSRSSKRRKVEPRQSNSVASPTPLRSSLAVDNGNCLFKERSRDDVGTCEHLEHRSVLKEVKGISYSCHEPLVSLYQSEEIQKQENDLHLERREDRKSLLPQLMQEESSLCCHIHGQTDPESQSKDNLRVCLSSDIPLSLKEFDSVNSLETCEPFEHCDLLKEVLEEASYSGHDNTSEIFHQTVNPQEVENDHHPERKEDGTAASFIQCICKENSLDYHATQVDGTSPRTMDGLEVNGSTGFSLAMEESPTINCLENNTSSLQYNVLEEVLTVTHPHHESLPPSEKHVGEEGGYQLERKEDNISNLFLSHKQEENSLGCCIGGQTDRAAPRPMDSLEINESADLLLVSRQAVGVDNLEDNPSEQCYVLKEMEEHFDSSYQNSPNYLHQSEKSQEEEDDFHLERKEDRTPTSLLHHIQNEGFPDYYVLDQTDNDPSRSMDDSTNNQFPGLPVLLRDSDILENQEISESLEQCNISNETEKETSYSFHEHQLECLHHEEEPQAEENDFHLERTEDKMYTSYMCNEQKESSLDCSEGNIIQEDSPGIICNLKNCDTGMTPVKDLPSRIGMPNSLAKEFIRSSCIKPVLPVVQSQIETKCGISFSPVKFLHSDQNSIPDEAMPEFEGFNIGSPIMRNDFFFDDPNLQKLTRERANAFEQLCKSMNISTSTSHFSTEHKTLRVPDVCHSFPSELLKCMSWDDLQSSSTGRGHLVATSEDSLDHIHCKSAAKFENSTSEKLGSYSGSFSSVNIFDSVSKGPLTPPVEKHSQKVLERIGQSSDRIVSNPELTCFRIDEHARSPEGSVCREDCQDTSKKRFGLRESGLSSNRKPLADLTSKYQNAAATVSGANKNVDHTIADSIQAEFSFVMETNDKENLESGCVNISIPKLQNKGRGLSESRNSVHKAAAFAMKMNDKDNLESGCGNLTIPKLQNKGHGLSESGNSVYKAPATPHDRLSKGSLKAGESKKSQVALERKTSNIVSNISSFVPLVRQKQQPAMPITGKRDIKVKALEAAETAKRQAEKKENERKMRKEASRLERLRLEKENARLLELKQKQKEEEKKKKEADIAARKRQREKEEKEDRQKKKNCTNGTRQKKANVDKICAEEKDLQLKALDKEQKKTDLMEETQDKTGNGQKTAMSMEMMQACFNIAGDGQNGSSSLQSCEGPDNSKISNKIMVSSSELQQVVHERNASLKENHHSQSYEISPYRDSDDEEEDDKRPKRKFVPSWARRESLDELLFSMKHFNPTKIFSRKRSFDLSEVLSFRTRLPAT